MKYIKSYEKHKKASIGDYVIMNINVSNKKMSDFINNNVGKIVNRDYYTDNNDNIIAVKYMKIPDDILMFFTHNIRRFYETDMVDFAKTKSELELKLTANKYNI